MAVAVLKRLGIPVQKIAMNGEEAAKAAAETPFDIIFMASPSATVQRVIALLLIAGGSAA